MKQETVQPNLMHRNFKVKKIPFYPPLSKGEGGLSIGRAIARPNLENLFQQVSPPVREYLGGVGTLARKLKMRVFVVGGFVRDLLLARRNLDLDLIVEGNVLELIKKLAGDKKIKFRFYSRFGTAEITLLNGYRLDLARCRKEKYPYPGSLPKVSPGTITDDLFRRDFTVNALALEMGQEGFIKLWDLYGGLADLQQGVIRVLHQKSFQDDPTRLLRAARFSSRLGFRLEPATAKLVKQAVRKKVLLTISDERVRNEILLILQEPQPPLALDTLKKWGLLDQVLPGVQWSQRKKQRFKFVEKYYSQFIPSLRRELVFLLILLDGLGRLSRKKIIDRLKLIRQDRRIIEKLPAPETKLNFWQPLPLEISVFRLTKLPLSRAERLLQKLISYSRTKISINGDDLKKLGLSPGPQFKAILEEVKIAKSENKLKNKNEEIKFVIDNFPRH